jgi:hypothetical protein
VLLLGPRLDDCIELGAEQEKQLAYSKGHCLAHDSAMVPLMARNR